VTKFSSAFPFSVTDGGSSVKKAATDVIFHIIHELSRIMTAAKSR
jgi:hypothetical protein